MNIFWQKKLCNEEGIPPEFPSGISAEILLEIRPVITQKMPQGLRPVVPPGILKGISPEVFKNFFQEFLQ